MVGKRGALKKSSALSSSADDKRDIRDHKSLVPRKTAAGTKRKTKVKPVKDEDSKVAPRRGVLDLFTAAAQEPAPKATAAQSSEQRSATASVQNGKDCMEWTAKHAPQSIADLVIDKKRVQAVMKFLESENRQGRLLIQGPSGSGKSAVVKVLAKALGYDILEWEQPVPTSWDEHQYQAVPELDYTTRLGAFERFVAHCKFELLKMADGPQQLVSQTGERQQTTVILIEDLPDAYNAASKARLLAAFRELTATARHPVIVVVTTFTEGSCWEGGSSIDPGLLAQAIGGMFEKAGGTQLSFNPIPPTSLKKVLKGVVERERLALRQEILGQLCEDARGNLFSALDSLQIYSRQRPTARKQGSSDKTFTERDARLGPWHALGKLLYNKRLTDLTASPEGHVAERYERLPMESDPEEVISSCGLDAASILGCLQENLPLFFAPEAIDEVAAALEYLSMADLLLSSEWGVPRLDNWISYCGASVAARGFMWSNARQPGSRGFLPLRAPLYLTVERARKENAQQLRLLKRKATTASVADPTEVLPLVRVLASLPGGSHVRGMLPPEWAFVWERTLHLEQTPAFEAPVFDSDLDVTRHDGGSGEAESISDSSACRKGGGGRSGIGSSSLSAGRRISCRSGSAGRQALPPDSFTSFRMPEFLSA